MKNFYTSLFAITISLSGFSQITAPDIEVTVGGSAGAGAKPFWNVVNQHGKYSAAPFEGISGLKIEGIDRSGSLISFDYGVEIYDRFGTDNVFAIYQGYAEIKTPLLTFRAGMKEDVIGNQDSLLTLGGTVWSANARPMPKLVISTPGYVNVPFTKGYVEVNGSLAHGWFEENRYVEDVYLHQKHAHIRFGGDFWLHASLGLIHFAQWGGHSPNPEFDYLPSDLNAYKRIFFAQSGDSLSANEHEVKNKLGNHLGARNYRIDYKGEKFTAGFYFQTIFEDNSGMSKEFYEDGIKGLVIKLNDTEKIVNHIVIEYLKTTWQSGPVHNLALKLKGNDKYFSHHIYRSGWSYHGMTLGTPFITSPIYNDEGVVGMINNRVKAYHLGLGGKFKCLDYRTMFTYSNNLGTYYKPFDPHRPQFSWLLETTVPSVWRDIDLNIMLAADIGKMYGNNLGVVILLRKKFKPFRSSLPPSLPAQ